MKPQALKTFLGIAAAAALAAVLASPQVMAQEPPPADRPGQARIERPRPLADLGLTPEQEKALQDLRKARLEESRAFRDEMAKLRDEMRGLAEDPDANRARIESLIDKRAGLLAAREKSALRARSARNKIFTPEQLEKLKTFRPRAGFRARLAGRGVRGPARLGARAAALRQDLRRMARLRALRHRPLDRWRRR
jgi:Spy/CpxP family protein refolding chaperone